MKKTGIRAFIYSFAFSLFAIFSADKAFFHEKSPPADELKISNKNIVLFLNTPSAAEKTASLPVKKISLSVLPEVEKPQSEKVAELLDDIDANIDNMVIAADGSAAEEFVVAKDEEKAPEIPIVTAKNDPEIIMDDFEKMIDAKKTVYEPANKILETPKEEPLQVASVHEEPTLTLPQAQPQVQEEETPFLIPLERTVGAKTTSNPQGKIEVVRDAPKNQVALADKNIPIKSMTSKTAEADQDLNEKDKDFENWETLAEKEKDADSPWLVAKGTKHPKNSMVLEDDAAKLDNESIKKILHGEAKDSSGEVKVAAEMLDNILIPIPKEILNDENLTPQLVSSEQPITKEEDVKILDSQGNNIKKPGSKGILGSITSMFSGGKTKDGEMAKDAEPVLEKAPDGRKKAIGSSLDNTKILPTEMRLSFQPNRAEISGNTLRWIQAFAKKAVDDQTTALEVRIDGTSDYELQQKRLNLLHNILTNRGVEYSKIKVVFTAREPNSFILRTIRVNEKVNGGVEKNKPTSNNGYYLQW